MDSIYGIARDKAFIVLRRWRITYYATKNMFTKIFTVLKNIFKIKKILFVFIALWVIFSIGYIARDQWQKSQFTQFQTGYQSGVADSISTLINESGKCAPVTLIENDKEVKMIAIDCLQNSQNEQQEQLMDE